MIGDLAAGAAETWAMHAWAAATAAVVAAGCGLVGTLLVVRRMSLYGDAIAHAVLPGVVIAALAGGRAGGPLVFAGAIAAALVTVWLTRLLRARGGLAEDAGAGVVFTTMFALGVALVTARGRGADLDPSCILAGDLTFVPFDTVIIAGRAVPRAFVTGGAVLLLLSIAAWATWKLQVFTAFDAAAARAAGIPVTAVTGGLLAATAVATVASFQAVGAILVVALLVVPAAAAELLVRRLHHVAVLAMALAVVGACLGYLAAWRWSVNEAGAIAVVLGIEYAVAAVVAPEDGIVARAVAAVRYGWRVACEDVLAALWRAEESGGLARKPATISGRLARRWLRLTGQVARDADGWRLAPPGRRAAETVVRSHRLWEAWLGRNVELPTDHLHPPAEWVEHHLGVAVRRRIEAELGQASDPHGSDIPPEA
jgi:ABC-type Mn2+/Zn2+ transport system permease subunit/Mn-dependent DtxR family transcriptional regulator